MKLWWGGVKKAQAASRNSLLAQAYHTRRHSGGRCNGSSRPSSCLRGDERDWEAMWCCPSSKFSNGVVLKRLFRATTFFEGICQPRMSSCLTQSFLDSGLNGAYSLGVGRSEFSSQARAAGRKDDGSRGSQLVMESRRFGENKSEAMLMYLVAMVVAMVGATYASVPLYRKFCQATGYGGTVQRRERVTLFRNIKNIVPTPLFTNFENLEAEPKALAHWGLLTGQLIHNACVKGFLEDIWKPELIVFILTVEEKIARHTPQETEAVRSLVVQFNADVADGMPWKFTPSQREVQVKPGQSTLAFYTAENTSSQPITGVSTYNITPMKAGIYFNKIQCFCFEEQRLLPGEKIDMPVFFYIDPEFASDPKMDGINSLILSYTFFKVEDVPE